MQIVNNQATDDVHLIVAENIVMTGLMIGHLYGIGLMI
jgi:hypothetical protein